ncbi:hypothetical protein C5167_014448 [Papaver somniferum]|uniref:Ubiquitin-like protease family profile domain-containing protein n=1 Tax=Papaver somniferum TaxID=3469 RepID=A0A4Y7J560_PAPSO|nr:hypothetical protein C5167_014448 [Papaver somniferum]
MAGSKTEPKIRGYKNKITTLEEEVNHLEEQIMQKDIVIEKLLKVEIKYESILGHARSIMEDLQVKKINKRGRGRGKVIDFPYKDLLESTLKFITGNDENPSIKRKLKPDEKQEGKRVRRKQESERVEQQPLHHLPDKGQLRSLEGNDLYDMMCPADKLRVEKLWSSKWREDVALMVRENLRGLDNPVLMIVCAVLEDPLFKEYLDIEVVHFYILRRKLGTLNDRQHNGDHKYLNCAYIDPFAWETVIKEYPDKEILVNKFIEKTTDNLDRLLIPMNNLGKHWTLLVFDYNTEEWNYYNSLSSNARKCIEDANKMASTVTEELNKKRLALGEKRIANIDVKPIKCPQQGSHPDCLMYTYYFMKRCSKINKEIEMNEEKLRNICHNMRQKVVEKMLETAEHGDV